MDTLMIKEALYYYIKIFQKQKNYRIYVNIWVIVLNIQLFYVIPEQRVIIIRFSIWEVVLPVYISNQVVWPRGPFHFHHERLDDLKRVFAWLKSSNILSPYLNIGFILSLLLNDGTVLGTQQAFVDQMRGRGPEMPWWCGL